jgi:site-specific recombinase XerD
MKAYRQDFDAIATFFAGDADGVARMSLGDITTDSMRTAFAQYAETREPASIQRCWSTWNVLCTFLYTSELIAANPMPLVGRPKSANTLPKARSTDSVVALLAALVSNPQPRRNSDWIERDRALILTGLLAGLRADELLRANVGDIRRTADGAVVHVRGKGGKDRRIPIESALVESLEHYLDGRATRFPATANHRSPRRGLVAWPSAAPLFVGAEGGRRRGLRRRPDTAGHRPRTRPGLCVRGGRQPTRPHRGRPDPRRSAAGMLAMLAHSAGLGSKGDRIYSWAWVELLPEDDADTGRHHQ